MNNREIKRVHKAASRTVNFQGWKAKAVGLNIRIAEPERKAFRAACKRNGVVPSDVIRQFVRFYIVESES